MKNLVFSFLFGLLLNISMAADLPALGDSDESVISRSQEQKLGKSIMYRLRKGGNYLDDPEIEDYINMLGYKLVSNSPVPAGSIKLFVVEDNSLNAFALPGGFIGVHTGLLTKVRSESELASVLAHEIAHVSQRHIARMIAGQKRAGMASVAALAVAILASRSSGNISAAAVTGAQAGLIQNRLNFSRDYEFEADRIGLKIIQNSDFDEHAVESFLRFMQRSTESSVSGTPSYLRTHPFFYERLADIQNRLQKSRFKQIPDSLAFNLVKARVKARSDFPENSVKRFLAQLNSRNYISEITVVYGLVYSLYLARQYEYAAEMGNYLLGLNSDDPMILALVGSVLVKAGDFDGGLYLFEKALVDFPNRLSLAYRYANSLLDIGRPAQAVNFLDNIIFNYKYEPRLFRLQAKGYAAIGNHLLQHRAQAEAYFYEGEITMAIEQLKLAKATNKGNFFEKSSLEARMKEFKKMKDSLSVH